MLASLIPSPHVGGENSLGLRQLVIYWAAVLSYTKLAEGVGSYYTVTLALFKVHTVLLYCCVLGNVHTQNSKVRAAEPRGLGGPSNSGPSHADASLIIGCFAASCASPPPNHISVQQSLQAKIIYYIIFILMQLQTHVYISTAQGK